jgi:hypothetical protein
VRKRLLAAPPPRVLARKVKKSSQPERGDSAGFKMFSFLFSRAIESDVTHDSTPIHLVLLY